MKSQRSSSMLARRVVFGFIGFTAAMWLVLSVWRLDFWKDVASWRLCLLGHLGLYGQGLERLKLQESNFRFGPCCYSQNQGEHLKLALLSFALSPACRFKTLGWKRTCSPYINPKP